MRMPFVSPIILPLCTYLMLLVPLSQTDTKATWDALLEAPRRTLKTEARNSLHHGYTKYTAREFDHPNKQVASSSHLPDLFVMQCPRQGALMRILVSRGLVPVAGFGVEGVGGGPAAEASGKLIWFPDPKSSLGAAKSGVNTGRLG